MADTSVQQTTEAGLPDRQTRLTEAGEMFLLACATMGGVAPFGRGSGAMVRRLRRDGLVAEESDECVCTDAGRRALADAGYAVGGAAS